MKASKLQLKLDLDANHVQISESCVFVFLFLNPPWFGVFVSLLIKGSRETNESSSEFVFIY